VEALQMLSFTQLRSSRSLNRVQMELIAAGSGSATLYDVGML
jgi:hypothetical protein